MPRVEKAGDPVVGLARCSPVSRSVIRRDSPTFRALAEAHASHSNILIHQKRTEKRAKKAKVGILSS